MHHAHNGGTERADSRHFLRAAVGLQSEFHGHTRRERDCAEIPGHGRNGVEVLFIAAAGGHPPDAVAVRRGKRHGFVGEKQRGEIFVGGADPGDGFGTGGLAFEFLVGLDLRIGGIAHAAADLAEVHVHAFAVNLVSGEVLDLRQTGEPDAEVMDRDRFGTHIGPDILALDHVIVFRQGELLGELKAVGEPADDFGRRLAAHRVRQ